MELTLSLLALYVGWNIGANDAANCIGTSVGSGLLRYRQAIVLMAVFVVLGAVLQGQPVMHTIGSGIVTETLPITAVIVALACAGLFVTLATFFRLPVSTSQAVVGGVAGVGFAAGAAVDLGHVLVIVQVWVVCPFLTALMAYGTYQVLALLLRRVRRVGAWDRALGVLVVVTAAYVAFSLGALSLGTAIGPIANLGVDTPWLVLLGGASLAVGALTYGHRVTDTVGGAITALDPLGAASAQAAAAIAMHTFSLLGIPVSTSQAVVGAVLGVALIRGGASLGRRRMARIALGWVAVPLIAGGVSFALYWAWAAVGAP